MLQSTSTSYTWFGKLADRNANREESARFDIDTRAGSSRFAAGDEKLESARDAHTSTEVRRQVERTRIKEKNMIYTYGTSISWILIKLHFVNFRFEISGSNWTTSGRKFYLRTLPEKDSSEFLFCHFLSYFVFISYVFLFFKYISFYSFIFLL